MLKNVDGDKNVVHKHQLYLPKLFLIHILATLL